MSNIKQICADLTQAETDGNYHKVLEVSNKRRFQFIHHFLIRFFSVVELGPKNIPVYQFKLVALIKLGLFEDALKLIADIPAKQLGYAI